MKNSNLKILRAITLVAVLIGAVASLDLMLHVGRHNNSVLLIILFSCWILSPFAGLLAAIVLFKQRPVGSRIMLYMLALIITIISLPGYGGIFNTPATKPAAVFLFVPLVSWILMLIVVMITKKRVEKA